MVAGGAGAVAINNLRQASENLDPITFLSAFMIGLGIAGLAILYIEKEDVIKAWFKRSK